jgi:hypothetical protein
MKDIAVSVNSGVYKEKILSTVPLRLYQPGMYSQYAPRQFVKSPCVIGWEIYDVGNFSLVPDITTERWFRDTNVMGEIVTAPSDCIYQVYGHFMAGITDFMTEYLFMGSCSRSLLGNMDIMCVDTWWLNGFFAENKASFKTIEAAFDASVRAATHFFREDGWEGRNVREHTSPGGTKGLLLGQVHETTICMIINLPWLIPPAALCSITILLLGATLVTNHLNRRQPVWKSSILPLPFYGLDEKSQNGGGVFNIPSL